MGIDADISEHAIRKLAHFGEYMILSLLVCADVLCFVKSFMPSEKVYPFFTIAPIFAFCVASVDEFCVQASTIGRGPSFRDVCIDTSGAVVGAILFGLALFVFGLIRRKRA
jgi:VanZ family protein